MSEFILLEKLNDGSVVEYPLDTLCTLQAQPGAAYSVVDESTGEIPRDLILRRAGDMLEVVVDEETVARIDDFYADDGNAALFTLSDASAAGEDVIIHGGEAVDVADGAVVWTAAAGDDGDQGGVSGWAWGGGLLAAAAAGGDDTAGVDGDSSDAGDSDYTLTVKAVAGNFSSSVLVEIFDQEGNLLTTGNIDTGTGEVTFTISDGYTGPLLIKVSDVNGDEGDYTDETTGILTDMDGALRAMVTADGETDLSVTVSPLTELAVRQAGIDESDLSLTEADVAVNDQIGALFGVEDITGEVTTVLDEDYDAGDGLSAAEKYGNILAMLSGSDSTTGGIDETLEQLENSIVETEDGDLAMTQEGVELLEEGADAFESGENGDTADVNDTFIEPPVISAAEDGLNAEEASGGVAVTLDGAMAGDTVTIYWGDQTYTYTVQSENIDADGLATVTVPESVIDTAGDGEIQVRSQINDGDRSPAVVITVDATPPSAPSFDLATDTGSSGNDGITNDATVNVTLASDAAGWEYSLDGGSTWNAGSGAGFELADNTTYNVGEIQVRQTDSAGNTSVAAGNTAAITTDMNTPATTISGIDISADTGTSDSDFTTGTASQTITATLSAELASGEILYGSVDGGSTWTDITSNVSGTAVSWDATLSGSSEIQFKMTDAAGNDGTVTSESYILDTTAPTLSSSAPSNEATGVAVDSNIILTFSEDIALGDSGTITITDGSDTHTIDVADHDGQLSISGNTLTINPTTDLANNETTYHVEVSSGAVEDLAGNDYAGISDSTTLNFDTEAASSVNESIVVFDLVEGVSSSHSGHTFDADTSYTIYIIVDSDSAALSADGSSSLNASATWNTWADGANLGADDTIVLVGNGSAVQAPFHIAFGGSVVTAVSGAAVNGVEDIRWLGSSDLGAFWIKENGYAERAAPSPGGSCSYNSPTSFRLWSGTWKSQPGTNGANLSSYYLTTMPGTIMTTQGLA